MSDKLQSALIAGAACGALAVFIVLGNVVVRAVGCCNCFLPIAAGAFAVFLYTRKSPLPAKVADGAEMGAITGAVAGFIHLIIGVPVAYAVSSRGMEAMFEQMRSQGVNIPASFSGGIMFLVVGILMFVLFIVLALLGGIIGVPLFEKRNRGLNAPPAPGPGPYPPPPPPGTYGT